MSILLDQFEFLASIAFTLFLPGYVLLRTIFSKHFSTLETFILALPLSMLIVNFSIIALGKMHIPITSESAFFGILIVLTITYCTRYVKIQSLFGQKHHPATSTTPHKNPRDFLSFSKRQGTIVLAILALTFFIKSVYLSDVILPTATDLGHHMYWSKVISETGQLPLYIERNIIEAEDVNATMSLGEPVAIDDFIIGEHIIFSVIALLSDEDYVSSFPIIVLLLINIFSVLACGILAAQGWSFISTQLSKKHIQTPLLHKRTSAYVFILTLLLLGPLYSLASPQAKFVSGGVVGNIIGNILIPSLIYLYSRALSEKNSSLLALSFFVTFGLAYTHHLSTLVFLIVFITTVVLVSTTSIHRFKKQLAEWSKLIFAPAPLLVAFLAVVFFFGVLAPSYADPKSLNTAIGTPTKATRIGLTFMQFTLSAGEGRLGLGLIGLCIIAYYFFRTRKQQITEYAIWFIFSWGSILTIMSLRPQWLFLDIPSNRISTYAIFPFAILAAYAFLILYLIYFRQQEKALYHEDSTNKTPPISNTHHQTQLSTYVIALALIIFMTTTYSSGMYDNSQSLLAKTKAEEAVQTYAASQYLVTHTNENTLILKDHNYIVADSWMKLFFLRGYTYPLSRGYFKRYEDTSKPREMCTLWMISIPHSEKGQKCFRDTGVQYIVVNPHYDSAQFTHSEEFSTVYVSDDIAVYRRTVK